ncbi:adhesion G-protein coupled receptor G7-like [Ciona intestinalis]
MNKLSTNGTENKSQDWSSSYLSPDICWPHGDAFHFGFLLPVAIILLFNVAVFATVTYSLSYGREKVKSTAKRVTLRKRLCNVVTMTTLLGLPWVIGFFSNVVDDDTFVVVTRTIHVVLNSNQVGVVCLAIAPTQWSLMDCISCQVC